MDAFHLIHIGLQMVFLREHFKHIVTKVPDGINVFRLEYSIEHNADFVVQRAGILPQESIDAIYHIISIFIFRWNFVISYV